MSKEEPTPATKPAEGWYKNEKGEMCFDGQCFSLVTSTDGGVRIEFDEVCELDGAAQAQHAVLDAAMDGRPITVRRRKKAR